MAVDNGSVEKTGAEEAEGGAEMAQGLTAGDAESEAGGCRGDTTGVRKSMRFCVQSTDGL
jgi:hypothetical protein